MKTSNKILLASLLSIIVILTGIHIALFAKYKSGDISVVTNQYAQDTITLKPFRFVKLTGLENVSISHSENYSYIAQNKMPEYFRREQIGDTLIITGKTASKPGEDNEDTRMYESIALELPAGVAIQAENSSVSIFGAKDSSALLSLNIGLRQSVLRFANKLNNDDQAIHLGEIEVLAIDGSRVDLGDKRVFMRSFSCTLRGSSLTDNKKSEIQNFSIQSDENSQVQLAGKNLQKVISSTVGINEP